MNSEKVKKTYKNKILGWNYIIVRLKSINKTNKKIKINDKNQILNKNSKNPLFNEKSNKLKY